jgi:hypothetical protein
VKFRDATGVWRTARPSRVSAQTMYEEINVGCVVRGDGTIEFERNLTTAEQEKIDALLRA